MKWSAVYSSQAERRDLVVQVEVDVKPKNQRTLPPNQTNQKEKKLLNVLQMYIVFVCMCEYHAMLAHKTSQKR